MAIDVEAIALTTRRDSNRAGDVGCRYVSTDREHFFRKLGFDSVAILTRYGIREGIAPP